MPAVQQPKHKRFSDTGPYDSPSEEPKPLGANKLKAQIRQTKRLLAGDRITPDVRVEKERRLKALELDLQDVERGKMEAQRASRYHHVKFFERQKVLRKLKRVLRELEKGKAVEGDKKAAEKVEKLQKELGELRVDLNYILHYPKALKYVSLYPEGGYAAHEPLGAGDGSVEATDPASTKDADSHRRRMRAAMAKSMEDGLLTRKPEETVGASPAEPQAKPLQASRPTLAKRLERGKKPEPAKTQARHLAGDDFFLAP